MALEFSLSLLQLGNIGFQLQGGLIKTKLHFLSLLLHLPLQLSLFCIQMESNLLEMILDVYFLLGQLFDAASFFLDDLSRVDDQMLYFGSQLIMEVLKQLKSQFKSLLNVLNIVVAMITFKVVIDRKARSNASKAK